MKIHFNIDDFEAKNAVLTIGSFDGVHRGHKKVISELIRMSEEVKGQSVIMIFWPHPRAILSPHGKDFKLINTLDERIKLLADTGIDHLIIFPFDFNLSKLTACLFIEKILAQKLKIKYFLVGYNQRFGSDRVSEIKTISQCTDTWGITALLLGVYSKKEHISSTFIRDALFRGEIKKANKLLSYKYFMEGKVTSGQKIGRTINFPTANLQINETYKLIPSDGVYALRVIVDNNLYNGMLNIGMRPTVNGKQKTIETHIFDFNEEIYGKTIKLILEKRIRSEKQFNDVHELQLQLQIDEEICRNYLKQEIKVSIAPDSFKGSMDSISVAKAISQAALNSPFNFKISIFPLADGGEGSIDILKFHKNYLVKVSVETLNPILKPIKTYYYADLKHNIAFIEFAKAGGLQLLKIEEQNPLNTTSYGVGLLLKDALQKMFQTIVLFVGGSGTNDAGMGILYALGAQIAGLQKSRIPLGENLAEIKAINLKINHTSEIIIAADVKNSFYGKNGAVNTFAKQKGADNKVRIQLEVGMKNIAHIVKIDKNMDLNKVEGSGSAGGVSGTLHAYLNAKIVSGAELIFDLINLENKIKKSNLIITGEGQIDKQTRQGKLISRLNKKAQINNIPLWAIAGFCEFPNKQKSINDIWHISSIAKNEAEREKAKLNPEIELKKHFLKEINKIMSKLIIK